MSGVEDQADSFGQTLEQEAQDLAGQKDWMWYGQGLVVQGQAGHVLVEAQKLIVVNAQVTRLGWELDVGSRLDLGAWGKYVERGVRRHWRRI